MANGSPLQAATERLVQVFRADASLSSDVREAVGAFCVAHGIGAPWCNRAQVIADELYMNAVKYGSASRNDLVSLGMGISNGTLSLSVEDRGSGNGVSAEVLRSLVARHREKGQVTDPDGRGLSLIVTRWSREMRIEPSSLGGIKVTSIIALS